MLPSDNYCGLHLASMQDSYPSLLKLMIYFLLFKLSFLVISIQLCHSYISDASTAAIIVTQSPWIQATYPRSRHDARLPLTATDTKIQSLQTASSATRLVTHALPNPTTAISNARAVSSGTTTSWTITYVTTYHPLYD